MWNFACLALVDCLFVSGRLVRCPLDSSILREVSGYVPVLLLSTLVQAYSNRIYPSQFPHACVHICAQVHLPLAYILTCLHAWKGEAPIMSMTWSHSGANISCEVETIS